MDDNYTPKFEDTEEYIPKFEDTAEFPESKDYSKSETALKHYGQGLTLGFSDELAGAEQAALDKLMRVGNKLAPETIPESPTQVSERLQKEIPGISGAIGPSSSEELYRQARDEERLALSESEKQNPKTSLASSLIGGFTTPGVSALGQTVKGTPLALKMLGLGAGGSLIGGASGLGTSTADLTKGETEKAIEDVKTGQEVGGILGASFPIATTGISKMASGIGSSNAAQNLMRAYKAAKSGTPLSQQTLPLQQEAESLASRLMGSLRDTNSVSIQKSNSLLKSADEAGQIINLKPIADDFNKLISDASPSGTGEAEKLNFIKDQFEKMTSNLDLKNLTPSQADSLRQNLNSLTKRVSDDKFVNKLVSQISGDVRAVMHKEIPGLAEQHDIQHNLMVLGNTLTGRAPVEYMPQADTIDEIQKLARTLKSSESNIEIKSMLDTVMNKGFKNPINEKITKPLSEMAPDAVNILKNEVPELAKNTELAASLNNMSDTLDMKKTLGAVTKSSAYAGEKAGQVVNGFKKLTGFDDKALQNLASSLALKGPTATKYANVIKKAVLNPSTKNAVLFGLMQRPDFRNMIDDGEEPTE